MANAIVEKVDEIMSTVVQMRKANDERIEELRKGNDSRANELAEKAEKINTAVATLLKARDDMVREQKAQAERMELLEALADRPKGTPEEKLDGEHMDCFLKALRGGLNNPDLNYKLKQIEAKQAELRKDVTLASNIGGGYALPKEIGATVEKLVLAFSDVVNQVKNITVGTSDYQELVSIFGGTSGWVAETATRSATGTPNLRNVKPTWGELYAYPQISEWSLQDIFFDVVSWLTNDIADGMAVALSTAIYNGNGTAKPTGMVNTAPVATADSASPMRAAAAFQFIGLAAGYPSPMRITMDSILNLVYSLKPLYRAGASFAMNSAVQGAVRMLKSTQGVYYWEPSVQVGQPDRLLGYPVWTWEDLGSNVLNGLPIAFGNFKRAYLLVSRREMNITQDQVTNPGYVRFYVRRRWGGMPLNNDSVKFLKVA